MSDLSCAKQREQWFLGAIQELEQCVQSLKSITATRKCLPAVQVSQGPHNHLQRFFHQQQVHKDHQFNQQLRRSLSDLRSIYNDIHVQYVAKTLSCYPDRRPCCELKRCAVYSQFFPESLPFAVWTLVADYADDHASYQKNVVVSIGHITLIVQLKCWCQLDFPFRDVQFLTHQFECAQDRSTCDEWDQLVLTPSRTVILNIASGAASGCLVLECSHLVYDLYMRQKFWNQDRLYPGIHAMF